MFSAVELLSVNHPNSSDIFVLLLCKDSRCLGIHGYLFEKNSCSLGSTVLPSWGWNTSPQHPTASKTWIQSAIGGAAPQKSLSGMLRGREEHTGQGREGTSLNARDGMKEGARLGSLPPEKGREGERR